MILNYVPVAKVAYSAYASVTGGKNFRGDDMPAFDDLPSIIKDAWVAAVKAARVGPTPTWREKDEEC